MVDERYKDSANFNEENVGNRLQLFDGVIEIGGPAESFRIRVKMLEKEKAERHDAGQLMKFAQDESPAQSNCQKRTPLPLSFSNKTAGRKSGKLFTKFFRALKL